MGRPKNIDSDFFFRSLSNEMVERSERTGLLLITSQYPTEKWHAFFPDPTVADAVLDRIVQKAHRINLKGKSMRKVMAKKMFQAV